MKLEKVENEAKYLKEKAQKTPFLFGSIKHFWESKEYEYGIIIDSSHPPKLNLRNLIVYSNYCLPAWFLAISQHATTFWNEVFAG